MAAAKKQRRQFVQSDKWEGYINRKYPGLLEIYRTVPAVAAIIRQGYIQNRPAQDIANDIRATDWFRGLGAGEYEYITRTTTGDKAYMDVIATRERQIRSTAQAGGYTLSDDAVKQIAADSLKNRWDETNIQQAVGKAVVTGAQQAQQPAAPQAAPTGLQVGADAASIRTLARQYGLKLADSQVEGYVQSVLTGQLNTQQIVDSFRNQAKSLYPSLATQLDQGDLESGVAAYRSIASQVLGVDPSQVDFTQDKYKPLLTYRDPDTNENRLMNATEWGNYLRTLPDWKKTAEAQNRYQKMIDTVDRVFGKVR